MTSAAEPGHVGTPAMPKVFRILLRITGVFALLLFLLPTFFVLKYYTLDRPTEEKWTALIPASANMSLHAKLALLNNYLPNNILLQENVVRFDKDPEARRIAVYALAKTLTNSSAIALRPIEMLLGKATLAAAERDSDPGVRTAAALELATVAKHGAVIVR